MGDWGEWLQQQGSTLVDRWSAREFGPQQTGDIQGRLQLGALGEQGYYIEGQAGLASKPAGMSTETKVLLGLGVVVVLLVVVSKD